MQTNKRASNTENKNRSENQEETDKSAIIVGNEHPLRIQKIKTDKNLVWTYDLNNIMWNMKQGGGVNHEVDHAH